jgi:hypothetical protein
LFNVNYLKDAFLLELMKKPNLFIVGHPKCGTSALYYYLKQHPDIFMPYVKEPSYFADDVNTFLLISFPELRTLKGYLSLFKDARDQKVVGEASPSYLCSKTAAKRIYEFNPDAKIIMVIREPVSFLYDHHTELLKARALPFEVESNFEKALNLEDSRKSGKNIPPNCIEPALLFYSDIIKYTEQIKRYLKYFPRKNVKIIIYEDFRKDNLKTLKEILEFIGVDSGFNFELAEINTPVSVKNRFFKRIIDIPYIKFSRFIGIRNRFNGPIRDFFLKLYSLAFYENRVENRVDSALRIKLMKKYKGEVEKVSKFLGRDLVEFWGYDNF